MPKSGFALDMLTSIDNPGEAFLIFNVEIYPQFYCCLQRTPPLLFTGFIYKANHWDIHKFINI